LPDYDKGPGHRPGPLPFWRLRF